MKQQTLCFIGGGNMATALIKGLIANGTTASDILVAEPDASRREQLAATLDVRTREDNAGAASEADIVILAVKPPLLRQIAEQLRPILQQSRPLVISVAAGIRHRDLQGWLGEEIPLVRAMPNTPAMVRSGATGLYGGTNLDDRQRSTAEHIMRATGLSQWVDDESLMDAVTAISGSGPAYFLLFMEALETAGTTLGLPAETARLLSLQTALGAARLAMESDVGPAELRAQVTSPGGTTEQAIRVFEKAGLSDLVLNAARAAHRRSIDMAEAFGDSR